MGRPYLPPWRDGADDPIDRLPGGDELVAQLTEAIAARLAVGERHTHARRAGCDVCAAEAADTAVRYLEANTRVTHSEALAEEEVDRAQRLMKSVPYLGGGRSLRLQERLAVDPEYPTVEDLLRDMETMRDAMLDMQAVERARAAELDRYRSWHKVVRDLATTIVEAVDPFPEGPTGE